MWKGPRASPFLVSAGLVVYDLLAFGSRPVQPHRHYRARQLLAAYPFVDREKLLGGFRYGDCQEDDARMTLTVVAAGQRSDGRRVGKECVGTCRSRWSPDL